jgi:hypothetical protein
LYPYQEFLGIFHADEELVKVQAARTKVLDETKALEERLLIRKKEIARLKEEVKALGTL